MSDQPMDGADSGLICLGRVRGMNLISANTPMTSAPMKTMGSQAWRTEDTSGYPRNVLGAWKIGVIRCWVALAAGPPPPPSMFASAIIGLLYSSARKADHSTLSSRGFGEYRRPVLAHGRPSTVTMSAVKSLSPRIREEPTP